ncbi:MAG: Rqc2 family fibronectin-binding protein, partial [bacterium]
AQEIVIYLRGPDGQTSIFCSIHPGWARVHLAPRSEGTDLSPFGQMLRSRLSHARLRRVEQPPFERTLSLRFETETGSADLIVEIMGRHSNLILVQDGVIAGALKPVPHAKSSVRAVLPGLPYVVPPHSRPTPLELTRHALDALLASSTEPLGRMLSTRILGLSPTMAVEVATRAGCDADAAAGLQRGAVDRLWDVLQELVTIVQRKDFAPVLYVDGNDVRGYAPFPLTHVTAVRATPVETMSEAVLRVTAHLGTQAELEERRAGLINAIRARLAKVARTEADLRKGLEEAEQSETARQRGELLLAYASQIPRGASQATVPGFDGTPLVIALDPTLTPVENARRIFARYTKIRKARPALKERLRAAAEEREYLEAALTMADQATSGGDLEELKRELAAEGYLRRRPQATRRAPAPQPRVYALEGGASIVVGRTNQDNDRVTFKVAGPDDLWFHARGVPGAHVILRTGGRKAREDEITQAASVAAYFSRARLSESVPVDFTLRRYVRKPKGSRPGVVEYEREVTLRVTPAPP